MTSQLAYTERVEGQWAFSFSPTNSCCCASRPLALDKPLANAWQQLFDSNMKTCKRCELSKSLAEFGVDRSKKDGYNRYCKECARKKARARYQKNPELYIQIQRRFRDEHRQEVRESNRKHDAKRREKKIVYMRGWHNRNRERTTEENRRRARQWARDNPDRVRVQKQRRRARMVGAGGSFTAQEFKELCDRYGNVCLACSLPKALAADHVIPIAKGGSSNIDNIQPLCKSCNTRKGAKIIDYRT